MKPDKELALLIGTGIIITLGAFSIVGGDHLTGHSIKEIINPKSPMIIYSAITAIAIITIIILLFITFKDENSDR